MKETALKAEIRSAEPAKAFVGEDGIYVPHCVDPRCHMMLISRELFVEAYNKWIVGIQDKHICHTFGEDDADDWSE